MAQAHARARVEAESLVAVSRSRHEELREQNAALLAELAALRAAQQASFELLKTQPNKVSAADRETIVERAIRPAPLNEVQARRVIDRMLAEAGWLVQDMRDLNPMAGRGVAVREFRLASGAADYVLYVDGKIVGVIEAKREGETLTAAQRQNVRYAGGVLKEHSLAVWHKDEPFAFRYATTGTETVFINRLDPQARSREVFAFHRPETVAGWMREAEELPDSPTYRARLRTMPVLETSGLRLPQIEAIKGLESSLAKDQPRGVIQMATGAGKTFTAVTGDLSPAKAWQGQAGALPGGSQQPGPPGDGRVPQLRHAGRRAQVQRALQRRAPGRGPRPGVDQRSDLHHPEDVRAAAW